MELKLTQSLFYYSIFMAVNFFYSLQSHGNFSFSGSLQNQSKQILSNGTDKELEGNLHQCVVDICSSFDTDKTYKTYSDQAALKTASSTFYDEHIIPVLATERLNGEYLLQEAEDFVQTLNAINGDLEMNYNQRKAIALMESLKLIRYPSLPIQENLIEMGPINVPFEMGYYFGDDFDEGKFNQFVQEGRYKDSDREILQNFIEKRNTEFLLPFLVESRAQFSSLINIHGKGAKALIDMAYTQFINFFRESAQQNSPLKFLVPIGIMEYKRRFVIDYFDQLVKMQSLSNYEYDFTTSISSLGMLKEFVRTTDHLIDPNKLGVPKILPQNDAVKVATLLSGHLKGQRESIAPDVFADRISKQCKWKLNYLYEGLPTEEELKTAERRVTQAIVQFQVWMFENLSEETATSVFDFLRSWEFFFPPSKREFADFVKGFLTLDRKNWIFSTDPNDIPVLVRGILLENQVAPTYHGLEKIETFCQTLNIDPIGDNTDSQSGQVHLGWMTLKDRNLLETVVWHELAHIVASLIRGQNKWNTAAFLNGKKQDFSVSLESFTKFFTTLQCLGSNQSQKISFGNLGEPFQTWFNQGVLEQFAGKDFTHELFDLPKSGFKVGDMGIYNMRIGKLMPGVPIPEIISTSREILDYINGEFIDEDWADLVAGSIAKEKANPFCFMLKGQDHLFWHEKKGKSNSEILAIPKLGSKIYAENGEFVKEYTEEDLEYFNAGIPKHSTLFYRFLHTETVRSGFLPPSCQRAKKMKPDYSDIKKCDYF